MDDRRDDNGVLQTNRKRRERELTTRKVRFQEPGVRALMRVCRGSISSGRALDSSNKE